MSFFIDLKLLNGSANKFIFSLSTYFLKHKPQNFYTRFIKLKKEEALRFYIHFATNMLSCLMFKW